MGLFYAAGGTLGHVTLRRGDWNNAMTVTVSGMPDADTLDERTTVSLAVSASGEDYAGQTDEVAVRVSDDDPAMKLSFSSSNYEAPEGGTPATVVVQLSRANGEDVTFPLHLYVPGRATRDSDYSGLPESVTVSAGRPARASR